MRMAIRIAAFAAIGVSAANLALAQGPIREGLRRTGEAAVDVTRGVAQGTANVARGVGQAAAGTARVAGDVLTPNTPIQARADGKLGLTDQGREARWRFSRHNNEWWYYNPQNNWMYHRDGDWRQFSQDSFEPINQSQLSEGQQLAQDQPSDQGHQYSSGYRGVEQGRQMNQDQGVHQQLRHDRHGRAYICENGRPVYVDEGQHHEQGQSQDGQLSPASATPEEYNAERQNLNEQAATAEASEDQSQSSIQANSAPATPTAPSNATGDADVSSAPAGDNTSSQVQPGAAAPREINNNPTPQTQGATENPGQ